MAPSPPRRAVRLLGLAIPIAVAIAITASCGGADDDSARAPSTTGATPTTETPEPADDDPPSAGGADEDDQPEPEAVVYRGDYATSIQPIFADRCASCHSPGGPGSPHWELATVADTEGVHEQLALVVEAGIMPPWPAGGDSPPFHEDRSLRPDQRAAIADWAADGGPIDVALETPIEPTGEVVGLDDPDLVVAPAVAYTGSVDVTDDYRCQIYDPGLDGGGWITGYEFRPDQPTVVHHAIGYLLPAEARARAKARDGEDGRPGWSCYGSSGLGDDDIFLGWAPGQLPSTYPEGTGLRVEPGAFLVVQIHYHYDDDTPADASTLALQLADDDVGSGLDEVTVTEYVAPAEIPCAATEAGPLCDRDAAVAQALERYGPEGVLADRLLALCGYDVADFEGMTDGVASASCDLPVGLLGGTGEIIAVLGHEHEIGAWFTLTLNPGTAEEKVLLDIPDWDFDWQYNYVPVERIVLDDDDVVRIECGWDRARRDPDLEPAYVLWADGTDDEMCFATITTRPAT